MSDIKRDIWRSLKVRSKNNTFGLAIYEFLLVFNSNECPLFLYEAGLQNLSDFDLLRSLKIKSNGAGGLPIYDFLLVFNSKKCLTQLLHGV